MLYAVLTLCYTEIRNQQDLKLLTVKQVLRSQPQIPGLKKLQVKAAESMVIFTGKEFTEEILFKSE